MRKGNGYTALVSEFPVGEVSKQGPEAGIQPASGPCSWRNLLPFLMENRQNDSTGNF